MLTISKVQKIEEMVQNVPEIVDESVKEQKYELLSLF